MTRPLRLADLYELKTISQPAVSPDGRFVAFVVQGFRRKENDRHQNLWLAPADGSQSPHRLTRGFTKDSSPAWSPDGRYLAFLSSRPHELEVAAILAEKAEAEKKGKGGGQGGGQDAGAGPDGTGDDEEKEPKPQLWVLDMKLGGEPRQLTWRDEGVEEFDWSPDSRAVVFASRDPTDDEKKYLKSVRGGDSRDGEEDKGPIVVDRVQHKHDRLGYLDNVRTHLFVTDVVTRSERPLTRGPCNERGPRWSPDGRWVLFVSNRTGDPDNNSRNDLWLIRPDGSETLRLTFGDVAAENPRFSPDSARVAFVSPLEPENEYVLRHLCSVSVADAEPVADLAAHVGKGWSTIGGVVPDPAVLPSPADPLAAARAYPVPLRRTAFDILTRGLDRRVLYDAPSWLDSRTLLVAAGDRGQTRLLLCSLDATARFVFPRDDRMSTLSGAGLGGGTVAAILDSPGTGQVLVSFPASELGDGGGDLAAPGGAGTRDLTGEGSPLESRATRLAHPNRELLADRSTATYRRLEFQNSDGDTVEALVAFPPGFRPDGQAAGGTDGQAASGRDPGPVAAAGDPEAHPAPGRPALLVNIHGGPMAYDSPGFEFDVQYWAGLGYIVLMVNYRGSTSYGENFCRVIRGDWGPREHDDIMSGVDAVLARGWADPERLFCTGFSQGGIMTNWAVGHTNRFRAAASEHGMWDYVSAFGTDDCHLWWQDDLGVPWQNEAAYRRISPASAVANINTPLLITAGEVDWRCPLSQSEQLYLALKKRGVETQLVIYQGERHAITRPKRAIDRIKRISEWFARHGGQPFDDKSAEGYPDAVVSRRPRPRP